MAYINPQLQIDQQQDATSRQNQAAIGQSLVNGLNFIDENRRRAVDAKKAQEATNLQYAASGATPEVIAKAESGDMSGIQKLFSDNYFTKKELEKSETERKKRLDESIINKNNRYQSSGASKLSPEQKQQFTLETDRKKMEQKAEFEKTNALNDPSFEVPGHGFVRTKEEAEKIRTAKGDAETAKQYIDEIKKLGKNVAVWDRDRVGKINQLKQALVGKLRLPLMGPGTMTEDEFQRTVGNLGDPSAVFGSESNEIGKLDQMSSILDNNVKAMYSAAARDSQPSVKNQQPQIPHEVIQKVQTYTPEQKAQRLEQLRAKKAGVAMGGN